MQNMKLLIFYTERFAYETASKSGHITEELNQKAEFLDCITAFIHVEEKDMEHPKKSEDNLVKNLKWAARKNNTKKILLHSFSHLSESKASPDFTKELLDKVEKRLNNSNYEASQTPFGYFLNLEFKAPGYSLARIFKDI